MAINYQEAFQRIKMEFPKQRERGKKAVKGWLKTNCQTIASLIKAEAVTIEAMIEVLGGSQYNLVRALKAANCPELAWFVQNEENTLIAELKAGYVKAKPGGLGAVRKWGRDNDEKIKRLREISKKTTVELSRLVGCAHTVFRWRKRQKISSTRQLPRKSVSVRSEASAEPQPEKFSPEFWQSLIATGKVGEVMADALRSLFEQIATLKSELADARKKREAAERVAKDCREKASRVSIEKDKALALAADRALNS